MQTIRIREQKHFIASSKGFVVEDHNAFAELLFTEYKSARFHSKLNADRRKYPFIEAP